MISVKKVVKVDTMQYRKWPTGNRGMPNPFLKKLASRVPLSGGDTSFLQDACGNVRHFPAKYDLIREGDEPGAVFVFLEGWGCRYKILPEGERQILAFLMPGDFCDMHTSVLNEMDHNIATVTASHVAMIPRQKMEELIHLSPAITRAFWLMQLVDLGIARSWIASMGRRGKRRAGRPPDVRTLLSGECFLLG
ncbi:Crp/Fnr family transcriptional regulator [Sphingomonas sp. H160509]|uniref:Crp/Fnr family transcriptional regulator n=1 Tax=Sphingomonas sp. H160509 TaxID=2955313 RepID=UPI00209784DC|nr:Crp/Fnr family transcriptional regulator [Sphingomonas sp. H160509]MDD1449867.1 Crp/Fnr family transcriptional regulator [Sphingomonas sp. H160509]